MRQGFEAFKQFVKTINSGLQYGTKEPQLLDVRDVKSIRKVILLFGTNDASMNRTYIFDSQRKTISIYVEFARFVLKNCPNIQDLTVLTLLPRFDGRSDMKGVNNERVQEFNLILKSDSDMLKIDERVKIHDLYEIFGQRASRNSTTLSHLKKDRLHLNDKGTQLLFKILEEIVSPIKIPTSPSAKRNERGRSETRRATDKRDNTRTRYVKSPPTNVARKVRLHKRPEAKADVANMKVQSNVRVVADRKSVKRANSVVDNNLERPSTRAGSIEKTIIQLSPNRGHRKVSTYSKIKTPTRINSIATYPSSATTSRGKSTPPVPLKVQKLSQQDEHDQNHAPFTKIRNVFKYKMTSWR